MKQFPSATIPNSNSKEPRPSTIRDFVYSSEVKTRDQFTLKNLLLDQTDNNRNFQSQQSQRLFRSNSRPNTMYGQRVRLFLQDENKRAKMQTQIKIKRQQSSNTRLNRCGSGVERKHTTQEEKIKMKKALGRVNLLAEGVELGLNQEQEVQVIFNFLQCLSEIENYYQEAFSFVTARLKQLVMADKLSEFGGQVKRYVQKNKGSDLLFNFVYRSLGKHSYQNLAYELIKQLHKAVQQLQCFQKKGEEGQQNTQAVIKEKQMLIKKLKDELKYYQEHPSQDLYPYIKKLQQSNGQMEEQISELVKLKDDQQYRIQIYENTNMLLSEQIQTLKTKIYELEIQELSGMKEVEKNSQLKEFEDNIGLLKTMLDKSQLKMKGMKDQFEKLKLYNEELLNERSVLAKRAAVGFGELTPRPKIKDIFLQNNLIFQKFFPAQKKQRSTQQMVKKIIKKLKTQPLKPDPPQQQKQKVEEKQEHADFGQQVMDEALEYIQLTKGQVNKTIHSAEQMKKSLNKQKRDRENMEKQRGGKKER